MFQKYLTFEVVYTTVIFTPGPRNAATGNLSYPTFPSHSNYGEFAIIKQFPQNEHHHPAPLLEPLYTILNTPRDARPPPPAAQT